MADTHRVILTANALSELESIARYIHQFSPENAVAVSENILGAIDSLAFMPTRFPLVGRSRKRGTPIRVRVLQPFLIYFRIDEPAAEVYVLHIRHGKRRRLQRFS